MTHLIKTFSDDGRWLVSAALDSTIRTWDLPTGHLIDGMRVPSVCLSLDFSPNGEFLATSHIDQNGINLWTNRCQFSPAPSRLITEDEIIDLSITYSINGDTNILEAQLEDQKDLKETPIDEMHTSNITMSLVPKSRWQNLLNLDIIKARNKPKEPPRAPEKAPFFLQLPDENEHQFTDVDGSSRVLRTKSSKRSRSEFQKLLLGIPMDQSNQLDGDATIAFFNFCKELSPAAMDIELRTLPDLESLREVTVFIRAVTRQLQSKRDFELCQAWMAVLFQIHSVLLCGHANEDEVIMALNEWKRQQEIERTRIADLVNYCSGVASFLRVR